MASLPVYYSAAFGEWRSLVAHIVRDDGVGGSNPLSPTICKGWGWARDVGKMVTWS